MSKKISGLPLIEPAKLLPLLLVLWSSFMPMSVFTQEIEPGTKEREAIINRIENIAEQSDQELDYSDLLEGVFYFLEHPLNLNYASFDEMKQLLFITDFQINKIIEYRNMYGNFLTIYELQAVEGLDAELIGLLTPFISVSQEKPLISFKPKDIFRYGKNDLFIRYGRTLEKQKGYEELSDSAKAESPNSYYLGSPDKLYARYSFNFSNKIVAGITADKDAGEEFFKGSQPKGFDFYSGFVAMHDVGIIKNVVVGDYHVQFGQGLTLWTGLAFGKSTDGMAVKKTGRQIKSNTSVNENLYLRGTSVTVGLGKFDLTGFYSSKKIDGNLDDDTTDAEEQFVTSLQQTGYHRTNAEMADKHALGEKILGGHIEFRETRFSIGATAYKTQFSSNLTNDGQLYKKFNFTGNENLNYGIDFSALVSKFTFFGEVSRSENGGKAYLAGVQANLNARIGLSVFYRNYGIDYQNLYSNALGENSSNQNEKGLYAGILLRLHKNWTFNGYADQFMFPWLSYRRDAPSRGSEYLAQLNYLMSRDVLMYFRFRSDNSPINESSETIITIITETSKKNYRFHVDYTVLPWLTLKNRIEYLTYKTGNNPVQDGFMIYQDILIRPQNQPFDVSLRYAIFDTDTYDERLYAYENDVLYAFSIPAYYYQGSRFYCVLRYELGKNLDFWLRYARTFYNNQTSVGSGLDESEGNIRSEFKVQLRFKF
jgi:hypothetical protein